MWGTGRWEGGTGGGLDGRKLQLLVGYVPLYGANYKEEERPGGGRAKRRR